MGINSFDQGQGFTTGADTGGYVLASVDIKLESTSNTESTGSQIPTVTIVQGTPTGTVVATLMNPASLAANTTADYTFTAPANTTLSASTTYYVVMEGGRATISAARTNLDDEDSGGESDWSIADVSNWRSASSNGSFSTVTSALMIKVKGPGGTTLSTDATLSFLDLYDNNSNTITLSPTFMSGTTSYTMLVDNSVNEITIIPENNDDNATYEIQDGSGTALVDSDSVEDDFQVTLSVGENTIKVEVTAEDTTTQTYTVVVTRRMSTTTPPAPAEVEVLNGWSLKPTGLGAGDKFRLLFLSSTKTNATSFDIADYNTFIQGRAAAGHTDIRTYSSGFRAVGCTADSDATANTGATGTGEVIYWLGGNKAADNYGDFYDGSWDEEVNDKDESGNDSHNTLQQGNYPFTGCADTGTESLFGTISYALGTAGGSVRVGRPNSSNSGDGPISGSSSLTGVTSNRPMYGLSQVFEVAANAAPTFTDGTSTTREFLNESIGDATADAVTRTDIGAPVTATDTDTGDTLAYGLEGTDAAKFTIDTTTGQIRDKGGENYDYETKASYSVTVTVMDGNGGSNTIAVTLNVLDQVEAPLKPGLPSVIPVVASNTKLDVTWTDPANTGRPNIATYDLRYRQGTSGNWTNGPQNVTGTSSAIESLMANTLYQVQIRATNAEGDSDWSESGSGTTGAPVMPTVSISADKTSAAFKEDGITYTLTRSGSTTAALPVTVALTQTKDFLLTAELSKTVTIAVGQSTKTFTVAASSFQNFATGTLVEGGTLTATVQDGTDYDLGTPSSVDVAIVIGVTIRLELASNPVAEAAGTLSVKVVARTAAGAAQPTSNTSTVSQNVDDQTTSADDFYVDFIEPDQFLPSDFTLTVGVWQAEKTKNITIHNDDLDEDDETFILSMEYQPGTQHTPLVDASGNSCGIKCEVTVTITDDDTANVTVSKTALTVTEDDTTGDTYTVVLDSEPTADVTITVGGYTGSDVTPNPTSLTFAPSDWNTALTVTVTAVGDTDTTDDTVTLTHSATSTDPDYQGITIASVTVTVEETATATGKPAITGAAQVGKTLTARIGTIADADGLPSTFPDDYTLQWRRVDADGTSNEADISGETSGTYTPVAADVGKKIKVKVSFTDNGSNAEGPLTSAAYPSNAPVAAAAGACPADNDWCTTLTVGFSENELFKYYGFSTAITDDGLADTTIDDGDGTTWTVSTMVIADAMINDQVHINLDAFLARGSVFDLGGTTFTTDETSESTVTTGNYSWLLPAGFAWVHGQDVTVSVKLPANAPATGVPEISGKPQVGATLSAGTTGIMDLDGLTSVSYTYQWIRVDVDGTSNPVDVGTDDEEYTLAAADEGKRIKVQVTFTDDDSNAEEVTSGAYLTPSHHSYPDRGIMPAQTACPASNTWCATMTVGFQLPGTDNTEFGFSAASPGYGALDDTSFDYDGSTFTVENVGIRNPDGVSGYHVRLDLDAFVPRGAVFDLNGYSFTTDATSEQTSTGRYRWALPAGFRIAEGVDYRVSLQVTDNTPAEGKPTISGPAQVGRTLTAATADITDDEGLTTVSYEYQWIAAGTDIGGATSSTYTVGPSVQGDKIAVRVTFDDDAGNRETLTSAQTAPVVPDAASCLGSAVWCSMLTVGHGTPDEDGEFFAGLGTTFGTPPESFGSLAGATFIHLGENYTVTQVLATGPELYLGTSPNLPDDGAGLTLHIQRLSGDLELPLSGAVNYGPTGAFPAGTNSWYMGLVLGSAPLNPPLLRGYVTGNGDYRQDTDEGTLLTVSLFQVNSAPVFPSTPAMRSVAENTASAQDVGAVLTATDSDNDPLTYTLEGTDAASFGIESASGQIFTIGGVNYDHETKSTYTVVVKADDSNGGTDTIAVTITVTDVNEPPAAPAAPTVSAITGSTTSLTVSWTAPANTGPPIDDYDLQYRQGNSGNFTNGPQNVSGTPATIDNLLEDTVYQVQVRASNDEGASGWSPSGSGRTSGGDNTATEVTILASSSSVPYSTFHDATFTVMRTGLLTDALTVTVNLTQDRPYLEVADLVRTVRIEAGSSSQNLVVSGTQLQLPVTDPVETGTLTATVATGTGYDIGSDASAAVDIVPFMTVRLELASYTVSEDVGSLSVKVIARTGNGGASPSSPFVLSISTESNTATVNQDYRLFSADPAFQPGTFSADGTAWKAEKTVEVTILNDTLDEPDESFSLQLQRNPGLDNRILIVNSAGAAPANIQRSTITIEDDDLPATPTVSFGASSYTAIEGVQSTAVTVQLIPADDRAVTIQLTETPQGGASSADYSGVPGSVTFAAGETEQTFTVTATNDSVDDDGESVRLGFDTLPSGITLGSPSTATVALVQDAGVSTWYVWFGESSYTVAEGGTARITLHLNAPWKPELNEALTVPLFDPQHEGGASADDYSGVPTSVTFQRGQTQTSFTVRATDDSEDDDGESVVLHFRRLFPDDLEVGRYGARVATLHLADNDGDTAVTVSFEAANYTAAEGGATATVRVLLDAAPGRAVTIPLTPSLRGATASDYSGLPASVTFGASETEKSFTVTATDDSADDDRESVAIGFGSLPSKVSAAARPRRWCSLLTTTTATRVCR